jgi:integrase
LSRVAVVCGWCSCPCAPTVPHRPVMGRACHWLLTFCRDLPAGCPDLRLHDLRHLFASGLIMAGCDVVTVQRAMGHSKWTRATGPLTND